MRKSVIASEVLHILAGAIAIVWLLWSFVSAGNLLKGVATLLVIGLAFWMARAGTRRRGEIADRTTAVAELPIMDTQGPVVLVCGDAQEALFQTQPLRKTAQGWWLRIDDVSQLTDTVQRLQEQQPHRIGQLSVMYLCRPDLHPDEAVMRASLKTLREQVAKLGTRIGFSLPVVLGCELSGPETPWVIIRGDKPMVCPENSSPVALADWQQTAEQGSMLPLLNQAFVFVCETLIDELEKEDRLYPPVKLFSVVLRTGASSGVMRSVWSHWLYRCSSLQFPPSTGDSAAFSRFPDAILPLLLPFATPIQGGQRTRCLVLLLLICALVALGFSATNNQGLIRQIGDDLHRWYAIPMDHHEPKAQSLAALKQDALLLERWQRQGEPQRYGLGYYPGRRLWLAVQQAIDTYLPPAKPQPQPQPQPQAKPVPQTIRLDSMSLFDSGKAELKAGSTKMLVNSLVGIKAKPGWLIVVSGHTDNTGNPQLNQTLSLKRAASVRDWMRDTGDVPESCFAVQGYGESRPVATNDTPEGRTLNRRVEISLVPQADACRPPDITPAPSVDDGALKNEME